MDVKSLERLELDKILLSVSGYAVLEGGKRKVLSCAPSSDIDEVRKALSCTSECDKILYTYGGGKIEQFADVTDYIERACKGSALSCGELLDVNALLRAARLAHEDISRLSDDGIVLMRAKADGLYFDKSLEDDIAEKIISRDLVSDYASEKLYSIRSRIRNLNEKIRLKLAEYLAKDAKYLRDGIVTIRNDRYVIPVKAEYKNQVRGFVHDRSQTGATFFIEPEYVLELNNELISLTIDEREEVEAILRSLSKRVGEYKPRLFADMDILADMDFCYARAQYSYSVKCAKPKVNGRGYINIIKGRHPLLDRENTVPVSVELGNDYDFLILSGANTGGKTVTLKMCGLFSLMASCGLFLPAAEGSDVAVFDNIFCDIGDSQSIEENLSTFSSHILNVKNICSGVTANSLVLIDELGGGTNPDEGQALAKAVVSHLLKTGCKGIITTHFTPLKEFAYENERIENASMEFDSDTLKPLYRIKIGLAGASNALAICRRLGLDENILNDALDFMSEGARTFENVLRKAEDSRVKAEEKLHTAELMEREWKQKLDEIDAKIGEINREKEKISRSARTETRRIISERCARADEILEEIEGIFKAEEISQTDLIRARTLKNKLKDVSFEEEESKNSVMGATEATAENLKTGMTVFVKQLQSEGRVCAISPKRGEAEVVCGNMTLHCKIGDLMITTHGNGKKEKKPPVRVVKSIPVSRPVLEINVLGMTVGEALYEVDNFIDRALTDNLEEIKVIHGVGTGKLKNAIAAHLKSNRNVESFRLGKYGEGESGVTIIKLR